MLRSLRCVAGTIVLLASTAFADPAAAPEPRLGYLKEAGTPLADVIDHLRQQSGRNIFVVWKALEQAGIAKTIPVTLDLSGLTLPEAVNALAREIGGTGPQLGSAIDDGVLTISMADDLARNVETRTYDIRHLIGDKAGRADRVQKLIRRVQGLDPRSWKANGGTLGKVQELGGQLIVTHTPAMHGRIGGELEEAWAAFEADPAVIRERQRAAAEQNAREQENAARIATLITKSHINNQNGQFEQALVDVDRILAIDPKNEYALNLRSGLASKANARTLAAQPPVRSTTGKSN